MPFVTRRSFLFGTAAWMAGTVSARAFWPFDRRKPDATRGRSIRGRIFKGDAPDVLWRWSQEAFLYKKLSNNRVICGMCPHRCLLAPGDRSVCRSKVNVDGILYSLAYGNPCAVHVDPVEKKPLYHFTPGASVFSLAVAGCNLRCLNCQNWEISQIKPEDSHHRSLFPGQVVSRAGKSGCSAIAYTYSEPITFFEYMYATAQKAKAAGIKNFWISNGYINPEPLAALCRVIDGANINLKAFSDDIYRRLNGGRLQPVLNTLKMLHAHGVHLEVTNLVVPGYTDDAQMVARMCAWLVEHIGPDHPLHFLRFFPRYKLDRLAPTPPSILTRFREIALKEGMRYVYIGNIPGTGNHTFCHHCGNLLVERDGYHIGQYHIVRNQCRFCGTMIPGVW